MARGFSGAVMRAYGARDHQATVVQTLSLAPHFVRVRMTSATLFDDATAEPTAWLRLWFPDPAGGDTEHQRAYTFTEADPRTGAFAVDFVLHEPAGPASSWAQQATPGQQLAVQTLGSSRFEVPEEPPAGYLLIGDSASLPAMNSIIAVLPADLPVELYFEQHHPDDDLLPINEHPRLTVHRVPRTGPTALAAAVEDRDWSNWYAWAGPESGSLKHLRTRLRDDFGFPKSEVHAQAYWYHGRAMGTLRGPKEAEPDSTPPPQAPPAEVAAAVIKGSWRAQAAGRLLAPVRTTLMLAGILQAIITLIQLAPYLLLVELARRLLAGDPADRLWPVGITALILLGAGTLLGAGLLWWLHSVDARFANGIRTSLLDKLARLPLGWFTSRGSGSVKQLVSDDPLALHYLVTHAVGDAVSAVVAPVAVLIYLFVVDWRLALLLLVPILAYVISMTIMVVQSGPKIGQAPRWAERMGNEAGSYLQGQQVIRVFGGAAASSFRRALGDYLKFLVDWQKPFIARKMFMDLVTRPATFLWLITALGTVLVTAGSLAPPDLLPFLLLGTTFGTRLLGIGYGLSGLRTGLLAARRIQVALDEAELTVRPATVLDGRARADLSGTVELDRVSFSYRPGVPVINEVSLTLTPGTVTALVGPSGSGKSTLAGLVARFHDVGAGAIRLGGRDIRELSTEELYGEVGFVLQDTALVHGTVRENIALAVPEAGDAQVHQAARDAQIHDRIQQLPQGYDTVLGGEGGLSGGERQRITIARTILADPAVLVLDEATAFADPEAEYLVQQALSRLTRDRTVLVIAHRLHTVTGADRIVVLDGGSVVESGTHAELLAADGRYRRLWDSTKSAGTGELNEVAR